ncbi:YbaK/EbsC family protein [Kitasatospora sp. NPDC004614]|uniref:YbaK/EbsC family protein n=1 Tax=unclassified Kitasatospora TaxID=2633591 RepID=UPI00369453BD
MEPTAPPALPARSALVADALAAAGLPGTVRVLDDSARTAAEAAAALGCEVGAIANSLVFHSDGEAVLVLTSGRHRVDTTALATRWGRGPLRRATPEQVREATGQAIGGVAPTGHPRPLPTIVDQALTDYPQIWAAAGTPHTVFPTTATELLHLTGGTLLPVGP